MAESIDAPILGADASAVCRKLTDEELKARRRAATARYRAAHPDRAKASQEKSKKRRSEDPDCRARDIARCSAYKKANAAKIAAAAKLKYDANAEKLRAEALARYHANRDRNITSMKIWRANNPDRVKSYQASYYRANLDRVTAWYKADYVANKEKKKAQAAARHAADPGYVMRRYHSNPDVMLAHRLRARLRAAMKWARQQKAGRFRELLGCDAVILRRHIDIQFTEGMTWDNYGDWHVDHIKPVCAFDLSDPEQQRACFHYTNLRPLWAADNLARSRKHWHLTAGLAA